MVISFFQIGCTIERLVPGFMDALMLSLCCVSYRGLLCGSLSNDKIQLDVRVGGQWNLSESLSMWNGELHLDGWMDAGWL